MVDLPVSQLSSIFVFLTIPFACALIIRRYNISPIIGYILGGIILGSFAADVVGREIISNFAYFGIVLLLFTIGMEVQLHKLHALKKYILVGGALQLLLSFAAISLLTSLFGFDLIQSILIGIALTSSSTAIVAKIIQDRGEEGSFLGEVAIGILMFQDLAFIPFIIIFSYFHGATTDFVDAIFQISVGCVKAAFILLGMYFVGKNVMPQVFNHLAKTSRELLNFFIIIFIISVVGICSWLGIPTLVGAFIAGVLVSQTSEHFHIFSQVRPLRDLLAIIFFIYVGSQVQLMALVPLLPQVVVYSIGLILVKIIVILSLFLYLRFNSRMAFSIAILLFQVSENAFILLALAFRNSVLTQSQYLFVTSSAIISLLLTPILIGNRDRMYHFIRRFVKKHLPPLEVFVRHRIDFAEYAFSQSEKKNHVVLCGFGRMGSRIGHALTLAQISYIAIDYNFYTVEKGKKEGYDIIYGDPTDFDILEYAGARQATAIIIMVPSRLDQESIILNAKKLNSRIIIISRAHSDHDRHRIRDLGAHAIISPEFEASLSVIKKIFILKRLPREQILKHLRHLKVMHGDIQK